jgi:hypothetical protein
MPSQLQIIPILCRTVLSDLCFIQPAFHEFVLVPSSGRLSPLYCHIFAVFLILYILHVSVRYSAALASDLFFLRTSQTSNNSSHWMDSNITPTIVFRKPHLPPYRKHAVLYGRCSSGSHLSENTASKYGNWYQCSNLSPDLACTFFENKIFSYDNHMKLVRIAVILLYLQCYFVLKLVPVLVIGSEKFEY